MEASTLGAVPTKRTREAAIQAIELTQFHVGDARLFDAVIASLEPRLRRQIASYVRGDGDEADDLFQDVCVRIFEQGESYRGDGTIGAWAARVCARLCSDHLRRAIAARHRMPLIAGQFDAEGDGRSESERTREAELFQEKMEAVTNAVVALPPRKRAIAIAHWYLGHAAARIASDFHLTAPTVWTNLSQIRATLRIALSPLVRQPSRTPI